MASDGSDTAVKEHKWSRFTGPSWGARGCHSTTFCSLWEVEQVTVEQFKASGR